MPDRGVFLAASLTLVLVVAGAFAIPEYFAYELLKSTIFVVVAVMVFFGEDKFPYMLGMVAPIFWVIFSLLTGEFSRDFAALSRFLHLKSSGALETPLHGFAMLAGLALLVLSGRAWRKQITDRFLGKTFALAVIVSLIWVGAITASFIFGGRPH